MKDGLERLSCLKAIQHITGKQSFNVLAEHIESIYTKFDMNDKITYSITDNGSNFVKSFR